MNPIPEPTELFESECNAQGLYGLPEAAFRRAADAARRSGSAAGKPPSAADASDASDASAGEGDAGQEERD